MGIKEDAKYTILCIINILIKDVPFSFNAKYTTYGILNNPTTCIVVIDKHFKNKIGCFFKNSAHSLYFFKLDFKE